jgi:hypothetical protein
VIVIWMGFLCQEIELVNYDFANTMNIHADIIILSLTFGKKRSAKTYRKNPVQNI